MIIHANMNRNKYKRNMSKIHECVWKYIEENVKIDERKWCNLKRKQTMKGKLN